MQHDDLHLLPDPKAPLTQEQAEYILAEIGRLQSILPTPDEMVYLRQRKLDDERATWAWQQVRKHAPWVAGLASALSAVVVFLASHNFTISGK